MSMSPTGTAVTSEERQGVAFTPGPWERSDYGEVYATDDGQTSIAMVLMRGDEGQANARLIAAAPDLFDALARLHRWVEADNDWRPDTKLARDVRAALARASIKTES